MPRKALILLTLLIALAVSGLAQKFSPSPGNVPQFSRINFEYQVTVTPVAPNVFSNLTYSVPSLPQGVTFKTFSPGPNAIADFSGSINATGSYPVTLTFTATTSSGSLLSGSGTYTFVVSDPPRVMATPTTVTFTSNPLNMSPFGSIQSVYVTSTGAQTKFTATIDDGNGSAAPVEFPFTSRTFNTPGRVDVSFLPTPTSTVGNKSARLILTAAGVQPVYVPITAMVIARTPGLLVVPNTFRFSLASGDTGIKRKKGLALEDILDISFIASLPGATKGVSVTPTSGTTSGGLGTFDVAVDLAQTLNVNDFSIPIMVSSTAGNARANVVLSQMPVSPRVRAFGKRLHFINQVGGSLPQLGSFKIYDTGSPNSLLNFRTTFQTGAPNDFSFGAGSITQDGTGTATPLKPYTLGVTFKPSTQIGLNSALLTVSSQSDPSVSTQFPVSLETLQNAPPAEADVNPASLVFVVTGPTPVTKTFSLSTTGATTLYVAAANTNDGGNWLSVTPSVGTLNNTFSPNITVTVNPALLPPTRVNRGSIDIANGDGPRASVVIDVMGYFAQSAVYGREAAAAACVPTQVVVAPGIRSGFSVPMGFASGISAEIYDDCGNALTGDENTVIAVFDNSDPPVVLENLGAAAGEGAYLGMWTPLSAQAATTVTFVAASGNLKPGIAGLNGSVTANQFNMPVLFDGGTVNNTNPFGGPVLSPGMVTSIYGLNLAPSAVSPGVIPLTNSSNGTSVTIGGKPAPFYFLSGGQLNVQAPTDLTPGQPASVAVQTATGFAVLPIPVSVFAAAPGVSSFADGHIIAQHADFTLVDAAHPAKPGESIVMYLSGMGATTPSVATGQQASATSLTPAQIQPTVTVGGQNASVAYAGLTPGGIGLYQINFTTPITLSAGDAEVVVTQNGVVANRTLLPVGAQ